jgi:hypothetical protein
LGVAYSLKVYDLYLVSTMALKKALSSSGGICYLVESEKEKGANNEMSFGFCVSLVDGDHRRRR